MALRSKVDMRMPGLGCVHSTGPLEVMKGPVDSHESNRVDTSCVRLCSGATNLHQQGGLRCGMVGKACKRAS
jgi:hypothetical protein